MSDRTEYTSIEFAKALEVDVETIKRWRARNLLGTPILRRRPRKSPVNLWSAEQVALGRRSRDLVGRGGSHRTLEYVRSVCGFRKFWRLSSGNCGQLI